MHIRDLFYINRSDRAALAVLTGIAVVAATLFYAAGSSSNETPMGSGDSIAAAIRQEQWAGSKEQGARKQRKEARNGWAQYGYGYEAEGTEAVPAERFAFDPNTADSTQLLRLGLKPYQVRNIYKYRARGGVYRKPADFAQLYGLTRQQFRQLEPYIRIGDDYLPAAGMFRQENTDGNSSAKRDTLLYPVKLREGEHVSLAGLDTTQLKKVPGIGSYYARRIADYGRRLGGYASTEQLLEIEGFPEMAVGFFTAAPEGVRKLKLNEMTLSQLKAHPYINFYQARAIVDRRRLYGPIASLDELRLLPEFPPEAIKRLLPYIEL